MNLSLSGEPHHTQAASRLAAGPSHTTLNPVPLTPSAAPPRLNPVPTLLNPVPPTSNPIPSMINQVTPMPKQVHPTPHHVPPIPKRLRTEPSFEEFLQEPEPHQPPPMPPNRPSKVRCYFNRDERYFQTLEKMLRGLVVHPPKSPNSDPSLDNVAAIVAASQMVTPSQLRVARLSRRRFLVLLPPTSDRDSVVAAIPHKFWDKGFTFHSYSPLSDTSIEVPLFKIWIDIKGVPLELQDEVQIARAISSFGLYLGSMDPAVPGDCHTWTVFLATDDLALVPHELEFKVGGMTYTAYVCPRKWIKGQVYQRHDLPPTPIAYSPPTPTQTTPTAPSSSAADPINLSEDDDVIHMSLTALREVLHGSNPATLPLNLAHCLLGDTHAIRANQSAQRERENRRNDRRILAHFTQTDQAPATAHPLPPLPSSTTHLTGPIPITATQDPDQTYVPPALSPITSRTTHPVLNRPTPHPLLTHPADLPPTQHYYPPTVHRTRSQTPPPSRTQLDLASQLCFATRLVAVREHDRGSWDPNFLFPEIFLSIHNPPKVPSTDTQAIANPNSPPNHPQIPAQQHPTRTARIRTIKGRDNDSPTLDIDAQDFVDIPLHYAEGRELLSLIGAADFPIPPHLMTTQAPTDTGHSNRLGPNRPPRPPTQAQPRNTSPLHLTQMINSPNSGPPSCAIYPNTPKPQLLNSPQLLLTHHLAMIPSHSCSTQRVTMAPTPRPFLPAPSTLFRLLCSENFSYV